MSNSINNDMSSGIDNSTASTHSTGKRFHGKTAIVTGAGSGMGRAAAIRLGEEGANVVLAGRRKAALEEVAECILSKGGKALIIPTDISDETQVQHMINTTISTYGSLDMAWNNAGVLGDFKPLSDISSQEFDDVMNVNLKGTFLCMEYELQAMIQLGGKAAIVNTSSWTAQGAMPGISAYAATKGALDAMMRTAALEVGDKGIRVNNVSPGIIATPMGVAAIGSEEAMRPLALHTPLQRLGYSEDVADAVLWLLSDDARFITGQNILVDGGFTLGGLRPQFMPIIAEHA